MGCTTNDKEAWDINDQFMFGKSLLVCPVTRAMYSKDMKEDFSTIKSQELYLPKGSDWFDFWTGEKLSGGKTFAKETPLDVMPLYVKAGSILPVGPKVQFAAEKMWDELEIRVYEGADGRFTLYEDENDNYNYEKGMYSTISFTWNEAKNVLTIHEREGSFPGMLVQRKFRIVKVTETRGTGMDDAFEYDKEVSYDGKKVSVKL